MIDSKMEHRLTAFLATQLPCISGCGGHKQLLRVASCLVNGYTLEAEEATQFLLDSNWNANCEPPWNYPEILHKCKDAEKTFKGERGWLLKDRRNRPTAPQTRTSRNYEEKKAESVTTSAPSSSPPKPPSAKKSVTDRTGYPYDDGNGDRYIQIERIDFLDKSKMMNPSVWNGRVFKGGAGVLEGVTRVPYNAVEVKEAEFVIIVEGEKCADSLLRFLKYFGRIGYGKPDIAVTCFIGGCNGFTPYKNDYTPWFFNKDVLIFADNDESGRKFANAVAEGIGEVVKRVRIVDTFPEGTPGGYDFSDWTCEQDWKSDYWQCQKKGGLEYHADPVAEAVGEYVRWCSPSFN